MPYKNLSDKLENNKKWKEHNPEKHARITREASARHYQNNKEKCFKKNKAWYENNPKKYLLSAAKGRAKKNNIEFSITAEDFDLPDICPVLGVPMIKRTRTAPSLDRIDPSKGYVPGNVQVISHKANLMKNDATKDELERFAKWILKI